jgi:hypothetical protein
MIPLGFGGARYPWAFAKIVILSSRQLRLDHLQQDMLTETILVACCYRGGDNIESESITLVS